MTSRLLKSLRTTAPKGHRPKTALNSALKSADFLAPSRRVSCRTTKWICRSTLAIAVVVFGRALANGQQLQSQSFPVNAPMMQSAAGHEMMPSTGNHWQRDAMQMMQSPIQTGAAPEQSASYLPPVHVPPPTTAGNDVPLENRVVPNQQHEQQSAPHLQTRRTDFVVPRRHQQRAHVAARQHAASQNVRMNRMSRVPTKRPLQSASDRLPTRYGKYSGTPTSEFNNTQRSNDSLIRRGPGLQDRISELISSPRYQAAATSPQSSPRVTSQVGPQRSMQPPQRVQPTPAKPIVKTPTPIPQSFDAQHAYRHLVEFDRIEPRVNRPKKKSLGRDDVTQAAMAEPVLSEPMQDPFGDYPALRTAPQSPDRVALGTQERTKEPISVLNRPVRHRGKTPNQTYLPSSSNRSSETDSEPDYGEPIYDSDPEVMFQDQNNLTEATENQLREPSVDDSFDLRVQDALDDNFGQLEELPESSADSEKALQDGPDNSNQSLDDENGQPPQARSCDEFRSRLLDTPITEIALDISPPRSKVQGDSTPLSRTWTDRGGNILATGTMTMLSRGYVVLDSGQKISRARLSDPDQLAISEYWQIPVECSLGNEAFAGRHWIPQTVTWKASALCHKTLFFENVALERYGHSHGPFLQPIQSTGHFFVSLLFLPYQAGIHPANECRYALGYYRPGNCAPWLKDPVPISLEGIKLQTLVTLGLAYIP